MTYIFVCLRRLGFEDWISISMDIFCSAGQCGGMHFPPSLWRAEEQALCETERKGETQKRIKGERGKYCSEEERRANNQGFWTRVRVLWNTWGRTGSITQRHGAAVREEGLPEVLLLLLVLLLLPVLRRPVLNEPGYWALCGTKFRRIYDSKKRRDLSPRCRVWVPGLTRFLWRRWSGNPARGWKCRRDTSQVQLETPAAIRASSPVRQTDCWIFENTSLL